MPIISALRLDMDNKKLLALAKKNAAKSVQKKPKLTPKYDDTLPPPTEDDEETKKLFQEMKKREF